MGDELRTPRLRLRRWRRDDTAVMAAINRDPEVTRFLNRDTSSDAIAAFLPRVEAHWEKHGFGFWAVELLDPGDREALIGFAGVGYPTSFPIWHTGRSSDGGSHATRGGGGSEPRPLRRPATTPSGDFGSNR